MEFPSKMEYSGSTRKMTTHKIRSYPNWGKSYIILRLRRLAQCSDSQAVRGSTTYMPDAMGVALNSSDVASHQVQLTGGGNLGSNNDNTSVIPAGAGVSVNNTGQNNIMEERSSGENTNTLSNSRDTPNASSMGPPVAAANATQCLLLPMAPQQPLSPLNNSRDVDYPVAVSICYHMTL
eukprot:scaffold539_cov68-Skeletonema_dohrnii-CCMP3373.AAC.1